MLNKLEKQFEHFITSMYGTATISKAQERDIELSFYAGVLTTLNEMLSLDKDEEVALAELESFSCAIDEKIKKIIGGE